MSWKIAIVVALLTAIITAITTAFVASTVAEKMGVGNFEGKRAYLVVALVLLAFVLSLVIGAIVTRSVGAVEWSQFWRAQGWSLAVSNGILLLIAGFCLLTIPSTLRMDGKPVALQVELFVPDDLGPTGPPSTANLKASLYAGDDDNNYVDIDTTRIHHEGALLVIPMEASLNTVSALRMLSLTVDDSTGYTLDMPLRPKPRKEDMEWTERLPMRLSRMEGTAYTYTPVLVRYRVVMKEDPAGR